jgi:hypothetical protein
MVFQVAGAVILPIVMLIVAASPFDEPVQVQPSNPPPVEVDSNNYVVFFILWFFWLLILSGIVYRMGKHRFRIKKEFKS